MPAICWAALDERCAQPSTKQALEELVVKTRARRPHGRILGVGFAMPGPFDLQAMRFVGPTTLDGWSDVPVRARLEEVTKLPG